MSNIGSGPGILPGIAATIAVQATASSERSPTAVAAPASARVAVAPTAAPAAVAVVANVALTASDSPVDLARVATIRDAIATKTYPVIPTKIGDAIIAFGIMMRMPQ